MQGILGLCGAENIIVEMSDKSLISVSILFDFCIMFFSMHSETIGQSNKVNEKGWKLKTLHTLVNEFNESKVSLNHH